MKTLSELEALPDEELRILCAELCGWKKGPEGVGWLRRDQGDEAWEMLTCILDMPDYTKDLNACHEIEKALSFEQYEIFRRHLAALCESGKLADEDHLWVFSEHATARQRTISFILTKQPSVD